MKLTPEAAKTAFQKNPKMKMTKLAKKKQVYVTTVSNAAKGKSLRCIWRPLMIQKQQEKCRRCCESIRNNLKSHGGRVIFFSDKKPSQSDMSTGVVVVQIAHFLGVVVVVVEPSLSTAQECLLHKSEISFKMRKFSGVHRSMWAPGDMEKNKVSHFHCPMPV